MAGKIIYPIVPSRFSTETWDEILDFLRSKGYIPFDHRRGAPFDDFEKKLGRERALEFLINIMRQCDATAICGISEGGMNEFKTALATRRSGKKLEILGFYNFDPDWEKYYEELKPKYGDLITELRGKNRLITLVGPRAVGKTFWINYLIMKYAHRLGRVKNTTTRKPRDGLDYLSYNFISEEEFVEGLKNHLFLECDVNENEGRKDYYGSSMDSIQRTIEVRDGIFAMTPKGVEKLYENRFGINLVTILLKAESEDVLRRNLTIRGITDASEQETLLRKAREFTMPDGIPHTVVELSGNADVDCERLISIIHPKI